MWGEREKRKNQKGGTKRYLNNLNLCGARKEEGGGPEDDKDTRVRGRDGLGVIKKEMNTGTGLFK